MNIQRGRLITLEGGDGVGKTTHIELLESYLTEQGVSVLTTREPGGTALGEILRNVLLRDGLECDAETEMMVLFAARAQHLHAVLRPAIARGEWVLCDRFTDATFAYQGGGRGISFERIARLETFVQEDFEPDLTLLLDLPIEVGLTRATQRGGHADRFEKQDLAFKERIRQSYLQRQRDNPERICRTSLEEKRDYCGPNKFQGVRDSLYRNEGNGRFSNVTVEAGISRALPGFGVICFDLTGDGWVDIYVANDLKPNQLWVNRRDGTFTDEALARGLALNGAGKEEAGMGVALGDADGDGRLDLFITHLADQTHTLYAAAETGSGLTYRDRSASSGIGAKTLPMTGWGCGFLDLENDGDLDLVIAHGRVARGPVSPAADCGAFWNDYAESNQLFLNRGNGKYSLEKNRAGRFSSRAEVSRGIAFADIDDDGDTDLLQSNLGEGMRLFRNEAQGSDNHWLRVRALIGPRDDLGALVTLETGKRTLKRPVLSSFSFACASDASVHFGLEKNKPIDSITVRWSDGSLESFTADGVDRLLVLSKGEGARKN